MEQGLAERLCFFLPSSLLSIAQEGAPELNAAFFLDEQVRMASLSLDSGDQCEQHPLPGIGFGGPSKGIYCINKMFEIEVRQSIFILLL